MSLRSRFLRCKSALSLHCVPLTSQVHVPFKRYWLRHSIAIWVELPVYAVRARRYRAAAQCLLAEAVHFGGLAVLWRLNSVATAWVFLLPFVISSFALMFGNW